MRKFAAVIATAALTFSLVGVSSPADARPTPSGPPIACRPLAGVKPSPACQPPRVVCKPIAGAHLPLACIGWAYPSHTGGFHIVRR